MFTPLIRFELVILTVFLGVRALPRGVGPALLFFAAGLLLAIGHFRHGTIWLAFRALKSGDPGRARRLLAKVRRPDWLDRPSRAYYSFLQGALALQEGNGPVAYPHRTQAAALGLRTPNDEGLVRAMLGMAAMQAGERETACAHLHQAKEYPLRPEAVALVEELEAELKGDAGGAD